MVDAGNHDDARLARYLELRSQGDEDGEHAALAAMKADPPAAETLRSWLAGDYPRLALEILDPLREDHVAAIVRLLRSPEANNASVREHASTIGALLSGAFRHPALVDEATAIAEEHDYEIGAEMACKAMMDGTMLLEVAVIWADRNDMIGHSARRALRLSTDPEATEKTLALIRDADEETACEAASGGWRFAICERAALDAMRERIALQPLTKTQLPYQLGFGTHDSVSDADASGVFDLLFVLARDRRMPPKVRAEAARTLAARLPKRNRTEEASALMVELQGEAAVMAAFPDARESGWLELDPPPRARGPMPRRGG